MAVVSVLSAVAFLLVLIALVEAGASRLAVPQSVMLALMGIGLGAAAGFGGDAAVFDPLRRLLADLPLSSESLTILLLPPLLFDAALRIDTRRLRDDAAPIFLLAVVAVCLTTFAVGLALAPLGIEPLIVCLLLGAIISTTDPLAVLAIFRDVGAPARLTRIVEGESLLNDAAAIALFTILLASATSATSPSLTDGLTVFAVTGLGGFVAGGLIGVAALPLIQVTKHHSAALTSITLALPYIAYVVSEELLGISGAVAVVAAGLVVAGRTEAGQGLPSWRHVKQIWEQLSFWASSLVFVITAFLAPRLVEGATWEMALAAAVALVAAFAARAVIIWGMMPALSAVHLAQRIDQRAGALLWWGGLRGSLTLLLALSVTEAASLSTEAQTFVAVIATAVTFFTILVNGLTLRVVMRLLGLHKLSALDRTLGSGARALATDMAQRSVRQAADHYGIDPNLAERAIAASAAGRGEEGGVPVAAEERVALALAVLAQAERSSVAGLREATMITDRTAESLDRDVQRMREGARTNGAAGYRLASEADTRFRLGLRAAHLVHGRTGLRRPLSAALAERFERLLVRRIVLRDLAPFVDERIAPVLGEQVAVECRRILGARRLAVREALSALTLQYPSYAQALEQRFLERVAVREEAAEYRALRDDGLIGSELSSALDREVRSANARASRALRLDLSVDVNALVATQPLFKALPPDAVAAIARSLRPRLVVPGERIITRGERGDTVFFIASGAVEVDTGSLTVRLGKGTCVGELAAFTGARRTADVTVLGYGEVLCLTGRAFRAAVASNAALRAEVEALVSARSAAPAPASPQPAANRPETAPSPAAGLKPDPRSA